jgi:hypothetical protein
MKYKLIKIYPESPKIGTEIIKSHISESLLGEYNTYMIKGEDYFKLPDPENYPEFWEEVIEKDYEILELSLQRSIKHQIVSALENSEDYTISLLSCNGNKIHSVKRLSDGEIFTIGDKCSPIGKYRDNVHSITKIWFCNPGYLRLSSNNYTLGIKDIQKVKIPLFTSEDGIDIFEGDKFYTVDSNFEIQSTFGGEDEVDNAWSSKEKAEEYILLNKPVLSLKDVASIYPGINKSHPDKPSSQSERLKDLVKSKIKQSV